MFMMLFDMLSCSSEDLCHGLRSLTGVKALEVTESNRDGGVQLSIIVGECSFEITLDSNKRVSDIIVSLTTFIVEILPQ